MKPLSLSRASLTTWKDKEGIMIISDVYANAVTLRRTRKQQERLDEGQNPCGLMDWDSDFDDFVCGNNCNYMPDYCPWIGGE